MKAHLADEVVREDVLGEGPGAWDPDPRYPTGQVNCLTWLQRMLAEVYGGPDPRAREQVMDRLRYYGGEPLYALRKHFTDHWLALDPAPFKKVDLAGCAVPRRRPVRLDFGLFRRSHAYACPLYEEGRSELDVEYLSRGGLADCAESLPAGHYVLFAAANQQYLKNNGQLSGPMGLVHAHVLQLPPVKPGQNSRRPSTATVYHASTSYRSVRTYAFPQFLEWGQGIHDGYALYELDPAWDGAGVTLPPEDLARARACEHALPPARDPRSL